MTITAYGYGKASYEDLPMLPEPFRLVVRQIKTDRGMITDIGAARQLKVIDDVFSRCDSIIVATDAGREGELIFRYIYHYLGYTKPFKRLWISSLTDEAIRKGLENLKSGEEYDSLYHAADCRAKADWLVGMNASRALAVASGLPNSSLGRVQTPTLAMICSRYKENRDFVPTPYWQFHITLERLGEFRQFAHVENLQSKEEAEDIHSSFSTGSTALITKVERKRTYQQAPLLYDLTALQKDCNTYHDMTAEKLVASYTNGRIYKLLDKVWRKSYYKNLPEAIEDYECNNGFEQGLVDLMRKGLEFLKPDKSIMYYAYDPFFDDEPDYLPMTLGQQIRVVYDSDDMMTEYLVDLFNSSCQETYEIIPASTFAVSPQTNKVFKLEDTYPERFFKWADEFINYIR